jgi:predicted RecB family nuclease
MKLPGMETITDLAALKNQIVSKVIAPPLSVIIELGNERFAVTIRSPEDIILSEDNEIPENNFVQIETAEAKLMVQATEPSRLKVGKDANGKPIFLKNLD